MYARLNMPFALRGYLGTPYVLVNMQTGNYNFLNSPWKFSCVQYLVHHFHFHALEYLSLDQLDFFEKALI